VVALAALAVLLNATVARSLQDALTYYPPRSRWAKKAPQEVGLDPVLLQKAIDFSVSHENPETRDLALALATSFGREPFGEAIGPTRERGGLNGIIVSKGYIAAEWGETERVDMSFSVTKSFLSTLVGLAWQRGMIRDVGDRVRDYLPTPELFASEHNSKITWDHLLRQTSDWQGTLWGKPDWADRPEGERPSDYPNRKLSEPGTRYKYNDVRVNLLALAALHVWRKPLPVVLREEVMDPIRASNRWRWNGYDNSWVEIDGMKVQSVSGGGHWGGGMFISAHDMARFGYLFLRNGRWNERSIVSQEWIRMARTPGTANPLYGYMNWFLNTERKPLPAAPESSVMFQGNGANIIYIDWENDLVVVVRWIQGRALSEFIGMVLESIRADG